MIYNNESVEMEFGTGDICVVEGYIPDEKIISFVGFTNQSAREIGSVGDIKAGEYDNLKLDVIMRFTNKSSIDVVISALQRAKEYIKE